MSIYNQNKGKLPLFDKDIIIDWYDGLCTGFSKLTSTNEWYILNIFYLDVEKDVRIYNVLKTPEKWEDETSINRFVEWTEGEDMMKDIATVVDENKSSVFFLKTVNCSEDDYVIVQPNVRDVRSCPGAADAWHGRKEVLPMLLQYFPDMRGMID